MVNNRTFSISGSIFGLYETVINLDLVNSNNDIIKIVLNRIRGDMKNYPSLLKELKKEEKKFHIHGEKFGNILISNPKRIFYICRCFERNLFRYLYFIFFYFTYSFSKFII